MEQEYLKRIKTPINLEMKPLVSKKTFKRKTDQKLYEGDLFLSALEKHRGFYCFDKHGKRYDTESFAKFLFHSGQDISLLIGGTYGLHEKLLDDSQGLISLSDMEFTHELSRLMLLEQIYRANCIQNNHPFHQL